ncbi:unnamed protein product [Medioppia subpectinata]|uniref:Uncharacterized protein n=1 Tax=Medioppia subpectinata TaxID=1979941 RepID=A0A7R9PTU6_9ACAR|nr:unnamed protein product [Medioppia subpectinata]CAG2101036.1 unnamed protein product [Medioppia subpectinata]
MFFPSISSLVVWRTEDRKRSKADNLLTRSAFWDTCRPSTVRLLIMIRDWRQRPPHVYGVNGGQNYLNTRLETNARQHVAACNTRSGRQRSEPRTINGQPITGHEFGRYFEDYLTYL